MKLALFIIFVGLPLWGACESPHVKIGVVAPLTGSASSSGTTIRNSILLAQESFDPSGSVKFIFEDDQLQPKQTVTAVNKLLQSDKVDGLIVFGSPTALAVNSIAESRKVPMLAFSIVERVVEGFKYVVKHWVSARALNDAVVKEVGKRGYKRIAVAATINDAMLLLKQLFSESVPKLIVIEAEANRDEADMRAIALRIISKSPDAVYNLFWAPQPSLFAKTLREQGYKGPIFGVHNLEDPNEIANAKGALEGAWLVTGDDSAAGPYLEAYTKRFGIPPPAGGVNAYDAAKLFIEAAKTGDINSYLHTVQDFKGAYGRYSASGRNDFTIETRLKIISNNSIVVEDLIR